MEGVVWLYRLASALQAAMDIVGESRTKEIIGMKVVLNDDADQAS